MKFYSIFLFTFFIVGLISSCKVSPEDPLISFRTREARIEGDWILDKLSLNGKDVVETDINSIELSINSYGYDWKTIMKNGDSNIDKGTWEIDDKDKRILIMDSYRISTQPDIEFYLHKVSNKELWLRQLNFIICEEANEFRFVQK